MAIDVLEKLQKDQELLTKETLKSKTPKEETLKTENAKMVAPKRKRGKVRGTMKETIERVSETTSKKDPETVRQVRMALSGTIPQAKPKGLREAVKEVEREKKPLPPTHSRLQQSAMPLTGAPSPQGADTSLRLPTASASRVNQYTEAVQALLTNQSDLNLFYYTRRWLSEAGLGSWHSIPHKVRAFVTTRCRDKIGDYKWVSRHVKLAYAYYDRAWSPKAMSRKVMDSAYHESMSEATTHFEFVGPGEEVDVADGNS